MSQCFKYMKKVFIISFTTILCLVLLVFFSHGVFAQSISYKIPNPSKIDSLEELINLGASLIRPLFIITFGAMILYGAFLLLSSQGDSEKVANSRKTIIAAIIGFIIAVFAPTILNFVTSLVGVEGLSVL